MVDDLDFFYSYFEYFLFVLGVIHFTMFCLGDGLFLFILLLTHYASQVLRFMTFIYSKKLGTIVFLNLLKKFFTLKKLKYTLIYNIILVSGVQHSDSKFL